MLRTVFVILTSIHGAIHIFGFLKASKLAEINQLTTSISKHSGMIWLLAGALFGLSISLFLLKSEKWWLFGFLAILLSQVLIIIYWQDAKFGTIANFVILIVCLSGFGGWKFDKMVRAELKSFLPSPANTAHLITHHSISHLPEIVQLWLKQANVVGKPKAESIQLTQSGKMKIKPDGSWMSVKAEQWFTTETPGFIWNADVGDDSFIQFSGRDKLVKGKGNMLIKLYSLFPIVDEEGSNIDQGVLVRFLSEIIWFPSAAIHDYITWEKIGPLETRAKLTYNNLSVTGIFTFNNQGQPLSFEAQRFYDKTGTFETWYINIDERSVKTFNGISIPAKANVTWKLDGADFTWYEVEVKELKEI